MTSWSRAPAHVRDATRLVPSTTSSSCFPTQASLNACLLVAQLLARTVVGRIGEPDDIAHLVSYLASKEAGFITGEHREY
jgi:NAD(P)-dependent dehydrogenase (short-subunit alcohol dehydrogenase family)